MRLDWASTAALMGIGFAILLIVGDTIIRKATADAYEAGKERLPDLSTIYERATRQSKSSQEEVTAEELGVAIRAENLPDDDEDVDLGGLADSLSQFPKRRGFDIDTPFRDTPPSPRSNDDASGDDEEEVEDEDGGEGTHS